MNSRQTCRQDVLFDELGKPWEFDDNIGPVLASLPVEGEVGDVGHGQWVYRRKSCGVVSIEKTTTPFLAEEMRRKRAEELEACREATAAYILAWTAERRLRDARAASPCCVEVEEDDSDDDSVEMPIPQSTKGVAMSNRRRPDRPVQRAPTKSVIRKPKAARPSSQASAAPTNVTWDPSASDSELLALCTMISTPRASTGRPDLKVVTPDGKNHRSRPEALRYMRNVA